MRVFHELVVDDYIEGDISLTGFRFSKLAWEPVFGHFDAFRIMVVADRISGASPALDMTLVDSPDTLDLTAPVAANLGSTLVAGQTKVWSSAVPLSLGAPACYGCTLVYWLTGTAPKAHVRIWVTGRDFA